MLKGITLAAGGRLANVSGDITVGAGATETLNLTLGADNINQDAAGAAIIDQETAGLSSTIPPQSIWTLTLL